MPSLIGQVGVDGTLATGVAANYRQQQVPFSRFGTRKIAWYKIGHYADGGDLDMVKFNSIIDAIQTHAEIVTIGAPYQSNNWAKFMVAVFEDTANDGENTSDVYFNGNSKSLQTTLEELNLGGNGVTVTRFYLAGAPNDGEDSGYYGFSTDPTYKEYDFKAEYNADSYLNPTGL